MLAPTFTSSHQGQLTGYGPTDNSHGPASFSNEAETPSSPEQNKHFVAKYNTSNWLTIHKATFLITTPAVKEIETALS